MLRSAFPLVSNPTEGDARRIADVPDAVKKLLLRRRRFGGLFKGDAAAHRTAAESLIAGGLCFLCIRPECKLRFRRQSGHVLPGA